MATSKEKHKVGEEEQPKNQLDNPLFRVSATWIWWIVGGGLTLLALVAAVQVDLWHFRRLFTEYPHLTIYIEIVGVGLLPLLITVIRKEDLAQYGLQKVHLTRSLLLAFVVVGLASGFWFIQTGQWIQLRTPTVHLTAPWNVWYAMLGVFAYGPLEVFFVVWLIANTERIVPGHFRCLSWGLILTVDIFGLGHLATTNGFMAMYVTVVFFLLGLIYKYTENANGPIVAWSLLNTQVWFLLQLLWS